MFEATLGGGSFIGVETQEGTDELLGLLGDELEFFLVEVGDVYVG